MTSNENFLFIFFSDLYVTLSVADVPTRKLKKFLMN